MVNNTYVEQIVADAKAAIDKAAEMGVVDPNRVGVGGHSYGAFMTANLLAHCNLFRAGIARDHALVIVARLMGQGLDGDDVAGLDLELRPEVLAEVAPMHGVGVGRQVMLAGARLRPRHGERGRVHPALEAAGQEGAALARHVLGELVVMELERRAGRIVALAHGSLLALG